MTPAWFTRELVEGDTGDDVLIVQRKLGVPMTGEMDLTTQSRIRGFQKQHGLQETGTMNDETADLVGDKASVGQLPEWYSRPLSDGDSGKDVAALRIALKQPNLPDYYDKDLGNAVRRFQASVGIDPTGCVDDHTAAVLAARLA